MSQLICPCISDAHIIGSGADNNTGAATTLRVGTAAGPVERNNILLKIDISGEVAIPEGSTTDTVTLNLNCSTVGISGRNLRIRRLLADFVEGTVTFPSSNDSIGGVSWNGRSYEPIDPEGDLNDPLNYQVLDAWNTAGAQGAGTDMAAAAGADNIDGWDFIGPTATGAFVITVPLAFWNQSVALGQMWLKLSGHVQTSVTTTIFASRDHATEASRPFVQVNYTEPEPPPAPSDTDTGYSRARRAGNFSRLRGP